MDKCKHFCNDPCAPDGCPIPGHNHPAPCDVGCTPCCPGEPNFCPVPPPVKPIFVIPGANIQEQMCQVINQANEAINRWNYIQSNCYQTLNKMVGAAVCNDVYYDRDEVNWETGYDTNDECKYSIIRIKSVDKSGEPIRMRLALAYGNTTNSNLKQSIQDVSFLTNANAIITAVNPDLEGWRGRARYMDAPIAGTEESDGYIAGFNRHGALKVFAANVDEMTLCQNQIENIIGFATPIILDGEVTEQAQGLTTKGSVSAIGYISGNGEKIFFQCSAQDANGMQGITVANLLKNLGCTTAVITAIMNPDENATNSNGMMYMGMLTDTPRGWSIPSNAAYWVVTKRPFCGWRNQFTAEIADLVQRTGQNWNAIQSTRHRVEQVSEIANEALELAKDNADRITVLEQEVRDINEELDEIQEHLTKHDGEIAQLQADLAQEVTDRENADKQLQANIEAEAQARQEADEQLQTNIDEEANTRQEEDEKLKSLIEQEEADRTAADAVLQGNINQEAIDRANADLRIEQNLNTEISNRTEGDRILQEQINNILNGTTRLPYVKTSGDTMTGALILNDDATLDLQAVPKRQLDEAVNQLTEVINGITNGSTDLPYVKRAGDTMTGVLQFAGVNKSYGENGIYLTDSDGEKYFNVYYDDEEERTKGGLIIKDTSTTLEFIRYSGVNSYAGVSCTSVGVRFNVEASGQSKEVSINTSEMFMGGLEIEDLADGTGPHSAATVGQIQNGSILPIASAEQLGAFKVGANLTITEDGVLNATGGGGGGTIEYIAGDGITISGTTIAVNNTYLSGRYLPLAGGTMTGALNMGNHNINNVMDPVADGDAVSLGYMESYITENVGTGPFLPLSGGTVNGNLKVINGDITAGNIEGVNIIEGGSNTQMSIRANPQANGSIVLGGSRAESTVNMYALAIYSSTDRNDVVIDANENNIIKVKAPVNDTDAANKAYVDSAGGPKPLANDAEIFRMDGSKTTIHFTYSDFTHGERYYDGNVITDTATPSADSGKISMAVGSGIFVNPIAVAINPDNGNVDCSVPITSNSDVEFRFTGLTPGKKYWIVFGSSTAVNDSVGKLLVT